VKERWSVEWNQEYESRMMMLIPAQYPKLWGETRIANKINMVGEVGSTLVDMINICHYICPKFLSGLDWPSRLSLEEFLPLHAPLLDFLVEDTKRMDSWKYPKLEELEKYQRYCGLCLEMLDRIEVRVLVCGVSFTSKILEVKSWIERMQENDQRDFGTRVVSLDVEDVEDVLRHHEDGREGFYRSQECCSQEKM
jgi:hypothetical protein